jgi:hypothetical protein
MLLQELCHVALVIGMEVYHNHKRHAVSLGSALKRERNALSPLAEAPMPTMVRPLSLFIGSKGAFASILLGFFVDLGIVVNFYYFFQPSCRLWLLPASCRITYFTFCFNFSLSVLVKSKINSETCGKPTSLSDVT